MAVSKGPPAGRKRPATAAGAGGASADGGGDGPKTEKKQKKKKESKTSSADETVDASDVEVVRSARGGAQRPYSAKEHVECATLYNVRPYMRARATDGHTQPE